MLVKDMKNLETFYIVGRMQDLTAMLGNSTEFL